MSREPTLAQRVDALDRRLRALERRLDIATGAILVVVVLGQMVLAAWIGTVIR